MELFKLIVKLYYGKCGYEIYDGCEIFIKKNMYMYVSILFILIKIYRGIYKDIYYFFLLEI